MLRFSLYAVTQGDAIHDLYGGALGQSIRPSALVAGNLYEQLPTPVSRRRHLITEPGDQWQCALRLSRGTDTDQLLLLPAV
jgi:hypothetical protein